MSNTRYKYNLSESISDSSPSKLIHFTQFLQGEWFKIGVVSVVVLLNTIADIFAPYIVARTIDDAIIPGDFNALILYTSILGLSYVIKEIARVIQSIFIGRISQKALYRLRESLFAKLQHLPLSFYVVNKSGDLISRINNDSERLSQTLSFSVIRFVANFFVTFGIAIFILILQPLLASIVIGISIILIIITRSISPWIQRTNKISSANIGELSAHIQENLTNFPVVAAFNRRDYFEKTLQKYNQDVYTSSLMATISSSLLRPIYDFAGQIAQVIVLFFGIYLITQDELTIGLLVGFIGYTQQFYSPLSILGFLWADFQRAIASWSRVDDVLQLENNLIQIEDEKVTNG